MLFFCGIHWKTTFEPKKIFLVYFLPKAGIMSFLDDAKEREFLFLLKNQLFLRYGFKRTKLQQISEIDHVWDETGVIYFIVLPGLVTNLPFLESHKCSYSKISTTCCKLVSCQEAKYKTKISHPKKHEIILSNDDFFRTFSTSPIHLSVFETSNRDSSNPKNKILKCFLKFCECPCDITNTL